MSFNSSMIASHRVQVGVVRMPNIKNIIAVTSGKGGVGKSTIAFNLAVTLGNMGLNAGILDADIYGPSLPTLAGERLFKPEVSDNSFVPLDKFGIKILSFGFLIDEKQPAIWRGAIVNKALHQLVFDTKWGELDVLVIDMPPGTGDVHLTMCQKIPMTGVLTVTTSQDIALVDVVKSISMYKKMDIPCFGIVENMSNYICSHCGHTEKIFGDSGAYKLSQDFNLDLLAALPLSVDVRKACDLGVPVVNILENSSVLYRSLAEKMLANLSKLPKDFSSKIGKITVTKK